MQKIFLIIYLFFSLHSFGQKTIEPDNIVREKSTRAMEVIGFFSGIEMTLDAISNQYSDLIYDVNRIKLLKTTNFGLCKKNAINYLKDFEDWTEYENIINKTSEELKQTIETNVIFSLKEESQKYLIDIEKKLKGNIDSPILENILSFQYQDFPHKEFINGFTYTFNTKNHSKSKNAEWQIKIPKSWMSKEADGPNIIQKFIYDCGKSSTMALMMTNELPFEELHKLSKEEVSKFYNDEILNFNFAKNLIPEKSKLISFNKMTIAGCPGGELIFNTETETLGINVKMKNIQYIFLNGNYMHLLQCGIGNANSDEDMEALFQKYKPTFQLIATSIKVIEKKDDIIYLKGNNSQKIITVNINNKNYDFILDTGATHSLINKSVINELISKKIISIDNFRGKDFATIANGNRIEVEIWQIPFLKVGNKAISDVMFSVINENNFKPLLGMDILQKLDIWKIDLENNKIYLK